MFKIILFIARIVSSEKCSIQREVINRIAEKPYRWSLDSKELMELYDKLSYAAQLYQIGSLTLAQRIEMLKYPSSSLNFLNKKEVPVNELIRFRDAVQR